MENFAEGVWIASAPQKFFGWQLGTRMTVLKLRDGSLVIHSPIAIDDSLKRKIEEIGPVGHIVAPNIFHYLYAADAAAAFPRAKLHGPAGLRKKRPELHLDAVLGEQSEPAWRDDLETLEIQGTMLEETVLWHKPSGTLVSADLVENFKTADDWWTRLYLQVGGIHGKVGVSQMLRLAYRDRRKARRDIDQLLGWDFDKIILAHGEPIDTNGVEALRETYTWLRG